MILWRISNHADLSGIGGVKREGRWHNKGRPVVYLAEHPALALLEVLVHFEFSAIDDLPDSYRLLGVEVPGTASVLAAEGLAEGWQDDPNITRRIGDVWLQSIESSLLRVPSVVVPGNNYLLNPLHPDSTAMKVVSNESWPFDQRLLKRSA